MHALALWSGLLLATATPAPVATFWFTPAPAKTVTGYSAEKLPCRVEEGRLSCTTPVFEGKSLRELSIQRNTVFARYGWDGYRKPWLRSYFQHQPWFKPNPAFRYKLLSDVDRYNVHVIATREQTFTSSELQRMKDAVSSSGGKGEAPLSEDARIELGLLSRAMGGFALDNDKRARVEGSLDQLLALNELRQLSLRDLRLLRNTVYARRGRPFKSKVLQQHFARQSWYRANDVYADALLTATDTRNIQLIRSVEDEFGGPLGDEDWLIDPQSDVA